MCVYVIFLVLLLGDSRNYMPPILVPSPAERTVTNFNHCKFKWEPFELKDFILRGFVCDIIRPTKELPVQS